MPYTVEYQENKGIVMIENSGKFSKEEFVKQAQETLEICRMNNCQHVLSDCTSMLSDINTTEIFYFPGLYRNLNTPRSYKLAILLAEDSATNEDISFYENVCKNRGYNVRIFKAKNEALKWLHGL